MSIYYGMICDCVAKLILSKTTSSVQPKYPCLFQSKILSIWMKKKLGGGEK